MIIKENDEFPVIRFDECIGCGACANICPVKAIRIEPIEKQIILD
ncbi:MAG: 4Fe-4S binding protein [Alphaproteobacteria bacterium]|nr:4Fe-4S binding protein [Alphaproteobacteria bacterium]